MSEPRTEAGKRLLAGHGHVEETDPDGSGESWCKADDEEWPCPFAQNLAAIEAEAANPSVGSPRTDDSPDGSLDPLLLIAALERAHYHVDPEDLDGVIADYEEHTAIRDDSEWLDALKRHGRVGVNDPPKRMPPWAR